MKLVHWPLMGGLSHLVEQGRASPLLAIPNVTSHPSTASVPIIALISNVPLLYAWRRCALLRVSTVVDGWHVTFGTATAHNGATALLRDLPKTWHDRRDIQVALLSQKNRAMIRVCITVVSFNSAKRRALSFIMSPPRRGGGIKRWSASDVHRL